jgi:hypothetical protein
LAGRRILGGSNLRKLLILLLLASFGFAISISLDQPSIHLETERGTTTRHQIRLTNNNPAPLTLRVYVQDWQYTETGAKEFLQPGTSAHSCADWIKLSSPRVTIPANSSQEYRFEFITPTSARGGRQAVIFFETESDFSIGNMNYGARLGALVYQKTRRHTVEAIEPIWLRARLQDDKYVYELAFENSGDAWNSVRGSVALIRNNEVLEQIELEPKSMLPGQTAEYFGSFTADVLMDRVEVLYMLEDARGSLQTGQLLTSDSAEAIAQTRVWIEKFEPVFNKSRNLLSITCQMATIAPVRVDPVVRIFRQPDNVLVKTVEFNPKVLRPDRTETMTVSWPTGANILGSLPPGEYSCVLSIRHGRETVTDTKTVRID